MKVLVVHRHLKVLDDVKSILRENRNVFRYFNSGLDGLLAARVEEFDLIICGTDLPVITGFEIIRSLRNQSMNEKTAVVFVTDEIDERSTYLGNALGVVGVLNSSEVSTSLQSLVVPQSN